MLKLCSRCWYTRNSNSIKNYNSEQSTEHIPTSTSSIYATFWYYLASKNKLQQIILLLFGPIVNAIFCSFLDYNRVSALELMVLSFSFSNSLGHLFCKQFNDLIFHRLAMNRFYAFFYLTHWFFLIRLISAPRTFEFFPQA